MKKYILAIDQGTTGSTAVLVTPEGSMIAHESVDFPQHFPQSGWVEHDPNQILNSVQSAIDRLLKKTRIDGRQLICLGITNQRETVVAWDKFTGKPLHNAIVWQDRRTDSFCKKLKMKGHEKSIQRKTGLLLDPYFSASKMRWLLDNVQAVKQAHKKGTLCFGTIDSYLIFQLTGGKSFSTEPSNASRTMLMNLKSLKWDTNLCSLFGVDLQSLPNILHSDGSFGNVHGFKELPDGLPITGVLGDQQSALFGQGCIKKGMIKCTFGTGSFTLVNTGSTIVPSKHRQLTTVAWHLKDATHYALEGSAFAAGACIQWLQEGLDFFSKPSEVEALANSVKDTDGVVFVPALVGLGAPYWDSQVRGSFFGMSRGTTKAHLSLAVLEGIAAMNVEVIEAMKRDSKNLKLSTLKVDGGMSQNQYLMQIQSDLLGIPIERPSNIETTSLGAALVAAKGAGIVSNIKQISSILNTDRTFKPKLFKKERMNQLARFRQAVSAAQTFCG